MERTRVLLAVDSTNYAQLINKCAAEEAPDLELMYFTDDEGQSLDSSHTFELLTMIADSQPDVVVHATSEAEPSASIYSWIFDQFPFVEIVHVDGTGNIRRIWQSISMAEFDNQAKESSVPDGIGRLFDAIRRCKEGRSDVLSAPLHPRRADYVKP